MAQVVRKNPQFATSAVLAAMVLSMASPLLAANEGSEASVRRIGDQPSSDYSLDLNDVPEFVAEPDEVKRYLLPDTKQQAKLESLLRDLAVNPGDRFALQEMEILLDDVLYQADQLMRYRKLERAEHLLRAVGHVNEEKAGLREAMAQLRAKQAEPYQYIVHVDESTLRTGRPQQTSRARPILPDPGQQARLDEVLAGLKKNPGSSRQMTRLNVLLTEILRDAETLAERGQLDTAARMIEVVKDVNPEKGGLRTAQRFLDQARSVDSWQQKAERALARERLVAPENDSAFYYYSKMLAANPSDPDAREGMARVQAALIRYANDAALNLDFLAADEYLDWAGRAGGSPASVASARERIDTYRVVHAERVEQQIRSAIARGDLEQAEFSLIDLMTVGGQEPAVQELQQRIEAVRPTLQ